MKNINLLKWLFMTILVLSCTGCEKDFLDLTNPNELTPDQFWKTSEDVDKAIVALYATIGMGEWSEQWDFNEHYLMCQEARSDMTRWNTWQPQQAISEYTYTPTQYMQRNHWKWCYRMIFTANQIIENVANMESLDETAKKRYDAEAKFARAHAHFLLLKNFGNIILVTEMAKTPEDFYKLQAPESEVWQQIENDFLDAKASLPGSWEEKWLGRVTSGAATAYLGKVYLFQEKWADAEAQFKEVTQMGYELEPDYFSLFTGLNEHNKESIWEINFSSIEEGGRVESVNNANLASEWEALWVTDWGKQLFLTDTAEDGSFSNRFYGSVVYDDPGCDIWYWDGMSYREYYTSVNLPDEDRMFWKKWAVYREDWPHRSKGDNNFYIIRYSDVLLMLAEALNEQPGKITEAIGYVNDVRERAGAALLGNMTQNELREHIRQVERPLEFCMEASRFDDLVRWYGNGRDGGIKAILTAHNRYSAENFIDGIKELWPIPQREIDANPNIQQNEGY